MAVDKTSSESDLSVIGDIAVPDVLDLGWSPADNVFIHLDGQEMVGEFFAPQAGPVEETSVLEFAATDIPVGSLLVDIDGLDSDTLDLNELLSETGIAPDLTLLAVPDAADSARSASMDALQDADLPDIAQMSTGLAFPQLTIVIDDDPGSDTVAL
jgi:hypothetical protein